MKTATADTARPPARPSGAGGRPRTLRRPPDRAVLGTIGVIGFLLLWEAVPRIGLVPSRFLPPASEVLATLGERLVLARFWTAVGDTVLTWAIGLGIAFAAAALLGFVVGSIPVLRAFTSSTVEFLRPIPSVALIPLAILLYGTDMASTLLLVVYAAFWQIYIQVLYGVSDIDPVAEQTARSYGLGRLARLRYVAWPSALPYVLTGLRLGAAVALILTITGQLVIGTPGLGQEISVAKNSNATELVYALIIATGALGVAVNVGVRALERRTLSWHPSVRGEENA
ncbi:ABC transporter permease [Streptomonospora salina]|uniref:ABC-type nitrate/sulfonate/bicarbonate transport system permease component n=1 Tax=Streptomonospora salina TaxID=104205 RepID=A0A841ECC5_9ACTN|nr:ABC transporter permease [Streptomonospora salina]MBB5997091.1 ABC-type nitrate/sulfonate/bicarbonate transport system permease component [Streptomonospora salina]